MPFDDVRSIEGRSDFWTLRRSVLFFAVGFLPGTLLGRLGLAGGLPDPLRNLSNSPWLWELSLLLLLILIAVPAKRHGWSLGQLFGLTLPKARWVALCVGGSVLIWPFITYWLLWIALTPITGPLPLLPGLSISLPEQDPMRDYLASVLLTPVVEEVAFRWILLEGLSRLRPAFAVLLSSLAFAAFHEGVPSIMLAALLGVWFCYIRLRSGSIIPSIIGHMVFNALGILMPWITTLYLMDYISSRAG